jgi:hypothetical protein
MKRIILLSLSEEEENALEVMRQDMSGNVGAPVLIDELVTSLISYLLKEDSDEERKTAS